MTESTSLSFEPTTTSTPSSHAIAEWTAPSTFAAAAVEVDITSTAEPPDYQVAKSESEASITHNKEHDGSQESEAADDLGQISQAISDKMRYLTAAIWALEQDDEMTDMRRRKINKLLQKLEETMDDNGASDITSEMASVIDEEPTSASRKQVDAKLQPETGFMPQARHNPAPISQNISTNLNHPLPTEADLHSVQTALTSTMTSMRLRHREQKHLHTLTVQKIELIAQRCLSQESQLQTLLTTISHLRTENQTLSQENDRLITNVEILNRERELKEATVTAMTGAVAGLEGWIENTTTPCKQHTPIIQHTKNEYLDGSVASHDQYNNKPRNTSHSHSPRLQPTNGSHPRRSIVKGHGRFRGRYYIDEQEPHNINTTTNYNTSTPIPQSQGTYYNAQDFHDGVKAWIRGFRDVEEYASSPMMYPQSYLHSHSSVDMNGDGNGNGRGSSHIETVAEAEVDDWGEFEGAG